MITDSSLQILVDYTSLIQFKFALLIKKKKIDYVYSYAIRMEVVRGTNYRAIILAFTFNINYQ